MHILVRHRWRFEVDPDGAPGWAAVLECLGHRVYLGDDHRHAAVDSALHGRVVILRVVGSGRDRGTAGTAPKTTAGGLPGRTAPAALATLLAGVLQQSGATVVLGDAGSPAPAAPGATGTAARIAADVLLTLHLDDIALRARVATAGRHPWPAWRLGRHLARGLWRAGCVPVQQRHWPGPAPALILHNPLAPGKPAWAASSTAVPGVDAMGALVVAPRVAATVHLPEGWPAEMVATAVYRGLTAFFGGPTHAVVPWPAASPAPATARHHPATAGCPHAAGSDPHAGPPAGSSPRTGPEHRPGGEGDAAPDEPAEAAASALAAARAEAESAEGRVAAEGQATAEEGAPPAEETAAGPESAPPDPVPVDRDTRETGTEAGATPVEPAARRAAPPAGPAGATSAPARTPRRRLARGRMPVPPRAVPGLPPGALPPGARAGYLFAPSRPGGGVSPAPPPPRPETGMPDPDRPAAGSSRPGRFGRGAVPSFATGRAPGSLQPFR
ncbi:hypothetical protein Tmar_0400 [Thermaerobacter marianensis DSM 12885]|uniref:Uncharacterized protein n=1 Tax=Thermaerobacter marianensis (strain ATCC 700841 / DSM 12885 / JCM 10246 / 7p75a) TaxID=644966 RepID=E6SGA4_THEM7|nr:hypothetical protein [Thermaerobacter marianensis]ADU50521.1 hypothetical protein Tmar_0400 [Thermaerobacter marianensis DSM 12885]